MNPEFKWGHIHRAETNPCLLIQEKTEISPGKEVILFTVFQVTEDIRLKRVRSIRTPKIFNYITKRTSVSKNTGIDQHFSLRVPYFPHVATHPVGLLPETHFLSPPPLSGPPGRGCSPSRHLSLSSPPLISLSLTLDIYESPTNFPCYPFSLFIKIIQSHT